MLYKSISVYKLIYKFIFKNFFYLIIQKFIFYHKFKKNLNIYFLNFFKNLYLLCLKYVGLKKNKLVKVMFYLKNNFFFFIKRFELLINFILKLFFKQKKINYNKRHNYFFQYKSIFFNNFSSFKHKFVFMKKFFIKPFFHLYKRNSYLVNFLSIQNLGFKYYKNVYSEIDSGLFYNVTLNSRRLRLFKVYSLRNRFKMPSFFNRFLLKRRKKKHLKSLKRYKTKIGLIRLKSIIFKKKNKFQKINNFLFKFKRFKRKGVFLKLNKKLLYYLRRLKKISFKKVKKYYINNLNVFFTKLSLKQYVWKRQLLNTKTKRSYKKKKFMFKQPSIHQKKRLRTFKYKKKKRRKYFKLFKKIKYFFLLSGFRKKKIKYLRKLKKKFKKSSFIFLFFYIFRFYSDIYKIKKRNLLNVFKPLKNFSLLSLKYYKKNVNLSKIFFFLQFSILNENFFFIFNRFTFFIYIFCLHIKISNFLKNFYLFFKNINLFFYGIFLLTKHIKLYRFKKINKNLSSGCVVKLYYFNKILKFLKKKTIYVIKIFSKFKIFFNFNNFIKIFFYSYTSYKKLNFFFKSISPVNNLKKKYFLIKIFYLFFLKYTFRYYLVFLFYKFFTKFAYSNFIFNLKHPVVYRKQFVFIKNFKFFYVYKNRDVKKLKKLKQCRKRCFLLKYLSKTLFRKGKWLYSYFKNYTKLNLNYYKKKSLKFKLKLVKKLKILSLLLKKAKLFKLKKQLKKLTAYKFYRRGLLLRIFFFNKFSYTLWKLKNLKIIYLISLKKFSFLGCTFLFLKSITSLTCYLKKKTNYCLFFLIKLLKKRLKYFKKYLLGGLLKLFKYLKTKKIKKVMHRKMGSSGSVFKTNKFKRKLNLKQIFSNTSFINRRLSLIFKSFKKPKLKRLMVFRGLSRINSTRFKLNVLNYNQLILSKSFTNNIFFSFCSNSGHLYFKLSKGLYRYKSKFLRKFFTSIIRMTKCITTIFKYRPLIIKKLKKKFYFSYKQRFKKLFFFVPTYCYLSWKKKLKSYFTRRLALVSKLNFSRFFIVKYVLNRLRKVRFHRRYFYRKIARKRRKKYKKFRNRVRVFRKVQTLFLKKGPEKTKLVVDFFFYNPYRPKFKELYKYHLFRKKFKRRYKSFRKLKKRRKLKGSFKLFKILKKYYYLKKKFFKHPILSKFFSYESMKVQKLLTSIKFFKQTPLCIISVGCIYKLK